MSYIDIFVLATMVLGLLIGLIGSFKRKLTTLITNVLSLVIAFFTCKLITNGVYDMIYDALIGALGEGEFSGIIESVSGMAYGIINLLVFWVEALLLMIIIGIIGKIIFAIIKHHKKKNGKVYLPSYKTGGVLGLVNGFIVGITLIFPVLVLSPALTNISSLTSSMEDEGGTVTEITTLAENQVKNSIVIKGSDWVLSNWKMSILKYENDGQEYYLYDNIGAIGGTTKLLSLFTPAEGEEEVNIFENLSNISDDDLREAFASLDKAPEIKKAMNDIISGLIDGEGGGQEDPFMSALASIDFEEISFEKEAETFIAMKNIVDFSGEEIGLNEEITSEQVDDVIEALENSDLFATLVPVLEIDPDEMLGATYDPDTIGEFLTESQYNSLKALLTPSQD